MVMVGGHWGKRKQLTSAVYNKKIESKKNEGKCQDSVRPIEVDQRNVNTNGIISGLDLDEEQSKRKKALPEISQEEELKCFEKDFKSSINIENTIEISTSSRRSSKASRLRKIKNTAAWKRRYGASNLEKSSL